MSGTSPTSTSSTLAATSDDGAAVDDGTGRRSPPKTDGRAARGARTRRAVAEAMIDLLDAGDPQPTARRIAARAGVSLRAVFHHFDDMEAVMGAAVTVQAQRHWANLRRVPAEVPFEDRLRRFVDQRARLYEGVSPVRRAAAALEASSPVVAEVLGRSRDLLHVDAVACFAPELTCDETAANALGLATSWETWEQLRQRGHGLDGAKAVVERLIRALTSTSGPPPEAAAR